MSVEPYGCPRRLYYTKTETQPDFPGELLPNKHMREGTLLEPLIAAEWARRTGAAVVEESKIVNPLYPHFFVHVDRTILPDFDHDEPGVLEIKSLAPRSWEKFEVNGLYLGYQLQMQHALLVTGREWGCFAIHRRLPDGPDGDSKSFSVPMEEQEIRHWEVAVDREAQDRLLDNAARFWGSVERREPPPPLPVGSKPCRDCPWREQCQGQRIAARADLVNIVERDDDPELAALTQEANEAQEQARDWSRKAKDLKLRLRRLLEARGTVITDGGTVARRVRHTKRLDLKALRAAHPELLSQYTVASTGESVTVKPPQQRSENAEV